jgi:hypothetical protein
MEKKLYNIFFNEDGIFNTTKAGANCEDQIQEAKNLLKELNEKMGAKDVTPLQIKVIFEIVAELAANSDNFELCNLYYDVQNIMTNAFLSKEEFDSMKGE